jgi:acyl-CoA synthetase (NDP forming)
MVSVKEVMDSRSVAVFGASQDSEKPGAMLLNVLKETGFQGMVAGVNPRGGEVYGFPLYPSLGEIPFPVDLAIMLIPPKAIPQALRDCARKGVKGVVISSEGFAETGSAGRQFQDEIRDILRGSGMRGFGPNTMGIVNTATGLTTGSFSTKRMLTPGSIGFISQTGVFVGALLRYLSSFHGLQISKVLGLGNKLDVDESDALHYLMDDEQTRIVGMYLEDIRDGRRFLEVAGQAVQRKPVILVKGGRTPEGSKASTSHTGSLAMDEVVLEGALKQAGVLEVAGIEEMIQTIRGFKDMPLPRGDRLAFVTYSGAQAIMSIDAATQEGLGVARFSEKTKERLARVIALPSKARNPIDIYPDMVIQGFEKMTREIIRALLDDDGVHGIFVISFGIYGPEPYAPMVEIIKENLTKPVFFSLFGTKEDVAGCQEFLEEKGMPFYLFPETGVRVFARMRRYARLLENSHPL